MLSLLSKAKIRADDFIMGVIIVSMVSLFFISIFILIVSVIVYPMIALFINGIMRIRKGFRDDFIDFPKKLLNIIYGCFAITFSILILGLILIQPPVTFAVLVVLLAFPLQIVGFAAVLKGIIIEVYELKHRIISIILGLITVIFSFFSILNSEFNSVMLLMILSFLLIANIISRFALYLSEFGLSVGDFENLKVVFMIINGYFITMEEDKRYKMTKYTSENE